MGKKFYFEIKKVNLEFKLSNKKILIENPEQTLNLASENVF